MALIILLDQFSRNIYRDTPQEVAQDAKALITPSVIERFGRFPYQNEIMGRPSTPEEIKFMNLPGAPFFL